MLFLNKHYARAHSPQYASSPRAFLLSLTTLAPPHALLVAHWGEDGAAVLSVPTREYFQSSGWAEPTVPDARNPAHAAQMQHQQQRRSAPGGLSDSLRPVSAPAISTPTADPDIANDDMDAPTDMDVKIAELSSKIDRLTEIILTMQRERSRDASQHTEPAT